MGCSLSGGRASSQAVRAARTSRPWGARTATLGLGLTGVEGCCAMLLNSGQVPVVGDRQEPC